MEVCKGTSATDEGDMGLSNPDAVSFMSSTGRNSGVIMARSKHISVGNAKVGIPFAAAEPQKLFTTADY